MKIYGYALGSLFLTIGMAVGMAGWFIDGVPEGRGEWAGLAVATLFSFGMSVIGVFVLHSTRNPQR